MPVDCTLSNRFQDIAPDNIWMQMNVRPILFDGATNPVVDTNMAWRFYINSNGNFVVHAGPAANPNNSTNWVEVANGGVETNGTNWITIGVYEDFTQKTWDLYTNGVLVTNDLGFINQSLASFTGFEIYSGASTSYIDNVRVAAPGTVTLSPTNLDFQLMRGVISNKSVQFTVQRDVWDFVNTTSAAWLAVSPATGSVSAIGGVTDMVISAGNGASPGSHTGTVTISAVHSSGFPQTRNVQVTLDVMDLQVAPTNLTVATGFMYSNSLAIPSQTFSVSNAGAATFNYTIEPQGDTTNWLGLSAYSGVAGSTNITVQYSNGLAPRAYTGEVWVVTTNGGGATSRVTVAVTVVARPEIALNPLVVTQTVAKGNNAISQNFTIWNGSVVPKAPMAYTLTPVNGSPELIQSLLDSGGGLTTGQTNTVTINYMDISVFETPGVYTAMVQVAAWDAGTNYAPTGTVQLTSSVEVRLEVVALPAPSGVTASDGTYTNRVAVSWNPVANATNYIVHRSTTFDSTLAEPIGETVSTSFDDLTGLAGVLYYYWVSSVNAYRGEGSLSTNRETGYRALAAPGGIFATDGAYTDKVHVTWPLVDGATGYQLYRGFPGGSLAPLYFTAGSVYDDVFVESGVHYEYRVAATNGIFGSTLSVGDIGYAFGAPVGLTASDGSYQGKVHLTWNTLDSASEYEVWRSSRAVLPPTGALKLATVTTPVYDDSSVSPGVMYYYWVRGVSLEAGIGGWSEMDRGYAASAGVDLRVANLVVLPVQVGLGGSPVLISFRMGNAGGENLAGVNGTLGIEFFASTNQVFGAGGEILIGKVVNEVTLAVGADMVMNVAGSHMVAPITEGDYSIFVRVLPEYPSLLTDTNPGNNVAKRTGVLRVRSSGGLNYQVFNDYDGDGISDLGVYRGMEWSVRSLDGRVLVRDYNVFSGTGVPVMGDMDGDRRADPIVHDCPSGLWQALFSGSGYMWASGYLGGSGYRGLVADYEGVGRGDASVFHAGNGRWYVFTSSGNLKLWNWGEPGYEPVTGDYDGDGHWDLAVYQESTGKWYIRTLDDQILLSGTILGGPGNTPVPGDYDGDGRWDIALYVRESGKWYIGSLDGRVIKWGLDWGAPGLEPVMGDYDGDGTWDLAMYQESTGLWYIASLDGRTLAWASPWGGPGYRPIGK